MKRYSVVPITLYRCQNAPTPKLRQMSAQFKLKLTAYDFKLGQNGLYNPIEGDAFKLPNGLSLRPKGTFLMEFLSDFTGEYIYRLNEGLRLPQQFVLIHERSDHYSLQTKVPIKPETFCSHVKLFFQKLPRISPEQLRQQLFNQHLKIK